MQRLAVRQLVQRLRALLVVLGVAGWSGCTSTASSTPQATGSVASKSLPAESLVERSNSRLFAWELQLGKSTFTLLGSVHVGRADLYPLDERLESRFARSDALILEVDTGKLEQATLAQKTREHASVAPGELLRQMMSETTFQLLEKVLAGKGVSVATFSHYRPWFVSTVLTQQSLKEAGFEPRFGIDEHFRLQAQMAGKHIIGLESLETQLSLLSSLGPQEEETLLRSTLEELAEHGEQLAVALNLWQRGDTAALDALLLQPLRREHPALFARIFVNRNRRMNEKLRRIAEQPGHYFVVVGAGHLMGAFGMVDLFSRRGIFARQL